MKRMYIPLLLLALAFAAGCQNTVNQVENEEKAAAPTVIRDRRFVTDGFLADRLRLQGVNTAEVNGFLQVQVSATNVRTGFFAQIWSGLTSENPYPVDYKFTWLDAHGMALDNAQTLWRQVTVYPGEPVYFRSVAPTRDCRDFVLNLKESNH